MFEEIYNNLFADGLYIYLLDGLKVTLLVSLISLAISFFLGLGLALIKTSKNDLNPSWSNPKGFCLNILDKLANLFITIIRGTPTTIQLLIMFNVILVNLDNLIIVAIVTFSLNSAAYMSEVMRGGLLAVDKGEIEAARSLGLSYGQTLAKVSLPQAIRKALPALGNEVITLLKETSITGFIGLADLTRGASIIISKTFKASIPYFAAALIYLLIVIGIEQIFKKLERRMNHVRS
uniref:amino acid ABC transporter permease n=1 Tax=Anaerococcus mediterraneensis TaxID=1870984 RepID=UPI0009302AFD|nr:amino acid ABC transporter permease [Anaerococcus mediterraneensis]